MFCVLCYTCSFSSRRVAAMNSWCLYQSCHEILYVIYILDAPTKSSNQCYKHPCSLTGKAARKEGRKEGRLEWQGKKNPDEIKKGRKMWRKGPGLYVCVNRVEDKIRRKWCPNLKLCPEMNSRWWNVLMITRFPDIELLDAVGKILSFKKNCIKVVDRSCSVAKRWWVWM